MLKRFAVVGSFVLATTSLGGTPPGASASIQEAFHGAFAEVSWQSSSTSFGFSLVSREQDGTTHLSVHEFTDATLDADEDVVGGTEIAGETTSGVSFSIDTVHYTAATVQGVIPVRSCTIVDGSETGCVEAGHVSLSALWKGVGPIPHFPGTELSWQDGCLQVDRNSSVEREADATVTLVLNGSSIPSTPTVSAGFGKGNSRLIVTCPLG